MFSTRYEKRTISYRGGRPFMETISRCGGAYKTSRLLVAISTEAIEAAMQQQLACAGLSGIRNKINVRIEDAAAAQDAR